MRIGLTSIAVVALTAMLAVAPNHDAMAQKKFVVMKAASQGSPYGVFHTRLATVVGKYTNYEIQLSSGATVVRNSVTLAEGKADLSMVAPVVTNFMRKNLAMFAKMKNAPELASRLRGILFHVGGAWTFVVYESSGIKSMKDLKGKTIFIGQPGSPPYRTALKLIEAATGYKAGDQFQTSKLDWAAGAQAFQDSQVDLYMYPGAIGSPQIERFALTRKIRILGLTKEQMSLPRVAKVLQTPSYSRTTIPPGAYGKNQVNTEPVWTVQNFAGLGTHVGADAEMIYTITKTIWEHLGEIQAGGAFLPHMVNRENAFKQMDIPLHIGALRYYREAGWKVPKNLIPPEAK